MSSPSSPVAFSEPELKLLQTLIYQECGMFFDDRRAHFLQDRLQRRLRACNVNSFYDYYRLLTSREGRVELSALLENLTVNETSFFRNRPQLELFQKTVLEEMLQRKQARRSSRWAAGILVLVAFNVALVGARNEVVRYLPQTASLFTGIGLPVNLRGLTFEDVRITKEAQDGVSMLIVEGNIVSTAGKPVEVPRLRFAARNATGQEVYAWTALPTRSILGPGERLEFRSQLDTPPADASDVMVRFFTAQDAMAGVK